jgi:predicted metal-binding membrane protein
MTSGNAETTFTRQRNTILAALILLAAACWAALVWQAGRADMAMMMSATMGMAAPLFLAFWIVMMAAMMFPAAAPMILTFASIQASRRRQGQAYAPTFVFVAGYMAVWVAAGVVAYAAAVAGEALVASAGWPARTIARWGGAMLVLAGLYQLTPLKSLCLSKCQSPISFIMTSWRDGADGAWRMGLKHGLYCLGCCWLLFVILFPLGMMNLWAMAILTILIFGEKTSAWGDWISRATAVSLILYGAAVLVDPPLLPTFMEM